MEYNYNINKPNIISDLYFEPRTYRLGMWSCSNTFLSLHHTTYDSLWNLPLSGACMWLGHLLTTSCTYSGLLYTGNALTNNLCATPSAFILNLIGQERSFWAYNLLVNEEYWKQNEMIHRVIKWKNKQSRGSPLLDL